MKKMYLNTFIAVAVSCLTTAQVLAVSSFILRNKYGAPVQYIDRDVMTAEQYSKAHPQLIKTLDDGKEVYVGTTYGDVLSLRRVGGSFSDVSWIIQQATTEERQHPNQIAVITIGTYRPWWNLSLSWKYR